MLHHHQEERLTWAEGRIGEHSMLLDTVRNTSSEYTNAELKVPTMAEFGISEERFRKAVPGMAAAALASGSPNNNPRVPTQEEIENLYHQIWDGV